MRNELIERTLEQLIENIEAGNEWRRTWASGMPSNYTTGRRYSGINTLLLWSAQADAEYPTSQWATYKQWQAAGHQVAQGQSSTVILIMKDAVKDRGTDLEKHYKMFKCAFVFNAAQLTEPPADLVRSPISIEQRHAACRDMVIATGASIMNKSDQPHYNKTIDVIGMPEMAVFDSADAYYATLFHELVHWTGHTSRLDRVFGKGSDYAFEELIAELGASFLCVEHGIDETPGYDNHAAYLANWLTFFKDDKASALMKAASAATKAVEFISPKVERQDKAA